MKTTISAAKAKTQFARLLREVESGETIAISKHDETVAFLIPRSRLEAMVETMEVQSCCHEGNSSARGWKDHLPSVERPG